jgi:hypothetical protein
MEYIHTQLAQLLQEYVATSDADGSHQIEAN